MLGLYGMPLPQLHFTGFETAFGEIAPRLAPPDTKSRSTAAAVNIPRRFASRSRKA
jgi:hypothetical protein